MQVHVVIIYGSARKARQGIKAARFVQRMLEGRGHDVELVEPFTYPLPLLDLRYFEYRDGEAPPVMERIAERLRRADGIVVVTGEYNHGLPPALKNILDHFVQEYRWKPSAIVSYSSGNFGGVRAAEALRALLPQLGMPCIPIMFPVSQVQDSFDNGGNAVDKSYEKRVVKFLDEFDWYMRVFKDGREKGTPY